MILKYLKKAIPVVVILLYFISVYTSLRPMLSFKGPIFMNVMISVIFLIIFSTYIICSLGLENKFLRNIALLYIGVSLFSIITIHFGILGIILNYGNILVFFTISVLESPFWGFMKFLSINEFLMAQLVYFLLIFLFLKKHSQN